VTGLGPYETSAQALDAAAALRAAVRAAGPVAGMTPRVRAARQDAATGFVLGALSAAGVGLGAFDREIAAWIAWQAPDTVQAVLGWIGRAHGAGARAARERADAVRFRGDFDPDGGADGWPDEDGDPGLARRMDALDEASRLEDAAPRSLEEGAPGDCCACDSLDAATGAVPDGDAPAMDLELALVACPACGRTAMRVSPGEAP
jgi:hypothetical protein